MPEYEYRCRQCDKAFVIERSMNDISPVNCSHCNSDNLARVWNATFLSGSAKSGTKSDTTSQSGTACAANPAKPKSCCPCS